MKIVIVGPGAIGCLFAGYLLKNKAAEVWLLDNNPQRVERIRQNGVRIDTTESSFRVKPFVTAKISDIDAADLAVICVKAFDTESAVKSLEPLLSNKGPVILTVQNGLGNIEIAAETAGSDRVLGGVTSQAATLKAEGRVFHAARGETVIGRLDGKYTAAMRNAREVFNRAGLNTRLNRDISSVIWSKLVVNAAINAQTALIRIRNGELVRNQETREIMSLVVAEAVRVAKKKRVRLIYDDPIQKAESIARITGKNISSMLQDVLNKRRTEIEYINGAIVRQAQSLNLSAPVNLVLTDLVRTLESTYNEQVAVSE